MSPIPNNRVLGVRVLINNEDVTHLVRDVEYGRGDVTAIGTGSSGVDAVVGTATLTLLRDASLFNLLTTDYVPVSIHTSVNGVWREDWRGFLGDDVTQQGDSTKWVARDPAKLLQDTQLDNVTEYGSEEGTPLETVVQQLMSQHLGADAPVLHCPVSPVALVRPYKPMHQSVWDAVQELVTRVGWFLGYQHIDGVLRLALLEPPRGSVPPPNSVTLDWNDLFDETFSTGARDVRNSVTIEFRDEDGERRSVSHQDEWSIENVTSGVRKHSHITLDQNTGIDTEEEADRLAQAFLADLSRILVSTRHELPYSPDVGIFTRLTVVNPGRTPPSQVLNVNSVRHSLRMTDSGFIASTSVMASGQVSAGRARWLDREARPTSPGDPPGPHLTQLRAPVITASAAPNGVLVSSNGLAGVGAVGMEVYASTEPGFTPGVASFVHRGPDSRWSLSGTPGVPVHVLVREFDERGGTGPWSNPASATPTQAGLTSGQEQSLSDADALKLFVDANSEAWQQTAQTMSDRQEFWDGAAATLDGRLETGTATSVSALSITDNSKDFGQLEIQPGDQVRVFGVDGSFQVRAVTAVSGGLLTVSEAWEPMPSVGDTFEVGRVNRITARAITDSEVEWRQEFGQVSTDLSGVSNVANAAASAAQAAQNAADDAQNAADGIEGKLNAPAITSDYSSIRQTAELVQTVLERVESDFVQSGLVDSATAGTLVDANGNFDSNGVEPGDVVLIMDGVAAGVMRSIASVSESTLVLTENWPAGKTPAANDSYVVGRPSRVGSAAQTMTAERLVTIFTDVQTAQETAEDAQEAADDAQDAADGAQGTASSAFSLAQQTATDLTTVTGRVNGHDGDIEDLETYFQPLPAFWADGTPRVWADGLPVLWGLLRGQDVLGVDVAFSLAEQNALGFQQYVFAQDAVNNTTSSTIQQLSNSITLKVDASGVISSINVSPESIRLDSDRIHLTGDTTVDGSFTVGGGRGIVELDDSTVKKPTFEVVGDEVHLNANTTVDGSFTVGGPSGKVVINDGAITTDKLTTSEINISTTGRATGRITARDASGVRRAAFGNVGGLFGAPAGAYGGAAKLGDGWYLEGAPRLVYAQQVTVSGTRNIELIRNNGDQYDWYYSPGPNVVVDDYGFETQLVYARGTWTIDGSILIASAPIQTGRRYMFQITNPLHTNYYGGPRNGSMNAIITDVRGRSSSGTNDVTGVGATNLRLRMVGTFGWSETRSTPPPVETIPFTLTSVVTVAIYEID